MIPITKKQFLRFLSDSPFVAAYFRNGWTDFDGNIAEITKAKVTLL